MTTTHDTYLASSSPQRSKQEGHRVCLRYASTTYALTGLSNSQAKHLNDRFGALYVDRDKADITIQLWNADSSAFVPTDTRGWEYRVAISHEPTRVRVSGLNFFADIDRETLHADLATSAHDQHFLGAFENLFRVLVSYRLLRQGILVMHSAAITDEEHGFLLFGHSGAGKTTLCTLAQSRRLRVLSDELNAVPAIAAANATSLLPMPFAGDFGQANLSDQPCPFTGIYAIEQGTTHKTRSCRTSEAVSRIVASCPYTNVDPLCSDALFGAALALVKNAPPRILTFGKDADFWDVLLHDR